MENLQCGEFLTESPSTSSASARVGRAAGRGTSSAPTTRQQQQQSAQQQRAQHRRRTTKSDVGLRQSSYSDSKLVLGQIPVSRKKQSTADRLNRAQWPSVLPLADKTVHRDDRCLESLFKAQSANPIHVNCFVNIQDDVTAHNRQQVVEWLCDVCREEHCEPDVFLLAVSILDRFLCVQCIFRNNLQALAGACLFVSSKVKAPQPLNAERIAYYTDGAVRMDQILQGEVLVLSKLNWDVSTSTALDFLDQVAARYSELHSLSEECRIAAHRIQLDEKFAFLVPSVQAAICLLYAARSSGCADTIRYAEDALINVLRCDPTMINPYMKTVQNLVTGFNEGHDRRSLSPSNLIAPPASESPHTPAATPPTPPSEASTIPETTLYRTRSHGISSEASQSIDEDSGFISGFSSPTTILSANRVICNVGNKGGGSSSSVVSRRRLRRPSNVRLNYGRRSYECLDSGEISYYHASEEDFLRSN